MSNGNKWEDYKKWVGGVIKNKKEFFYRGQLDAEWKLQTAFHRTVERKSLSLSLNDYLTKVIPVVHYYISAWHNEIINLKDPNEFSSFLSLLQHYGFPTPLLDWTMSPYIAAYFAFREVDDVKPQCSNVKIFIFDFNEWTTTYQQPLDLSKEEIFVSVIVPYAKYNQRIINQQGVYTVANVSDMAQHIINSGKIKNKTFLYEYTLSVKERPQVMRELNLMGINEMSLFPSIDGICKTMREIFFSKDVVGLTSSELLQQLLNLTTPSEPILNPFIEALKSKNILGKTLLTKDI